jgi:hypothetical protein
MDIYSKSKSVAYRFLRAGVAGAVSSMILIQIAGVNSFADLETFLKALTIAGLLGGINGTLMALDKYFRME